MARGHSRPDLLESDPGSKAEDIGIVNGSLKILVESLADGMIGYENQLSRAATQSGLRTLASGSRDPNPRAAAVRIEVREGNPLASIQELSNISGLHDTVHEPPWILASAKPLAHGGSIPKPC